jgi:uncharacterized protein (DUF433 family)
MLTKDNIKKSSKEKYKVRKIGNYPYIVQDKNIANGSPIISGTRIAVRTIAGYYQLGMNVDEILSALKHLTQAQVHSALAFYFDNQKDIDKEINDNSDIDYWKKRVIYSKSI